MREQCAGLTESGIYHVNIETETGEARDFLLAHDADVQIGAHRGGLDTYAWEGIEISEVSVATLLDGGSPTSLPDAWRRFHVFLPTAEPCPYPLIVNGAFVSDLSRQEIRVGEEQNDYNRFLMRRVAALFRDRLATQLERDGASVEAVLRLLDRGAVVEGAASATPAGQALYEAMRDQLSAYPFLPNQNGERLPLSQCVVPPLVPDESVGAEFRDLLPEGATRRRGQMLPASEHLRIANSSDRGRPRSGRAPGQEAAAVLGAADPRRRRPRRRTRPAAYSLTQYFGYCRAFGKDWTGVDATNSSMRFDESRCSRSDTKTESFTE